MVSIAYRYLYEDRDRNGNVRVYFWRGKGHPKTRIRSALGSPQFHIDYEQALAASLAPVAPALNDPLKSPVPGSYRWLCCAYMASPAFKALDRSTQAGRRGLLQGTYEERESPTSPRVFADVPVESMTPEAVRVLRDRKATWPEAANGRVKALRQVFKWALEEKVRGVRFNAARDVAYLKGSKGGFHTWTIDEVRRFEEVHPIGSKARLALALYIYTGARKSDVVRLGRQHIRNGWLKFTAFKGRRTNPVTVEIPLLAELRRVIDASPTGDLAFLVTELGRPFTANGFGNRMRKWCDEAGLPDCSSHGLRKAAAATAAENGATVNQLMAIFGWLTEKEAVRYTREARRKKLAASAPKLLGKHRA